jgi:tetratricopeptide (TPR) repeat protein
VGRFQLVGRDLVAALSSLRDALAIVEAQVAAVPTDAEWQHGLMFIRVSIGDALVYQGRLGDATESYLAALNGMDRFAAATSRPLADILVDYPGLQGQMIEAANRIGVLQAMRGRFAEALKYFEGILAIREYLAGKKPDSIFLQEGVLDSYYRLGRLQLDVGSFPQALQSFRKGLTIVEPIAAADRKNALAQRQIVLVKDGIGRVALAQGRIEEALALARANVASAEHVVRTDPKNGAWRSFLALAHERVGDALVVQGDLAAALVEYRTEVSLIGALAASNQSDNDAQTWLSTALFKIGEILRAQELRDQAQESYRASLGIREPLAAATPDAVGYQAGRLQARWRVLEGDDAAAQERETVLASLRELRDDGKLSYEHRQWLAQIEIDIKKPPSQ